MAGKMSKSKRNIVFTVLFVLVNIVTLIFFGVRTQTYIDNELTDRMARAEEEFNEIMSDYKQSFQIFVEMMAREIENNPDPDDVWNYLKSIDSKLLEIEGETFDGLYMYYKQRYLYSWDIPYSEYEGYVAEERPWYQAAVSSGGEIAFTPPYKSYAYPYMLTTISQMQPDGETIFAYDIKLGDIQSMVEESGRFDQEEVFIYDSNGTIIGSSDERFLGGNFYGEVEGQEAFSQFRQDFDEGFHTIVNSPGEMVTFHMGGKRFYGGMIQSDDFNFMIMAPVWPVMKAVVHIWLVPLLTVELLMIYIMSRIWKRQKNRELEMAYIELGQMQKRLEIALGAAQKAAAVDDLTGLMNYKSFRNKIMEVLDNLGDEEHGILIMIDIDHFKQINDNYGHLIGDEVIKLTAQMMIGRIRIVDFASRLHGDEFAIFIANASDYAVAGRIMEDINVSIQKEAARRNIPAVTLSAGAVAAKKGDTYVALAKAADAALYAAKREKNHNGGFSY